VPAGKAVVLALPLGLAPALLPGLPAAPLAIGGRLGATLLLAAAEQGPGSLTLESEGRGGVGL